jgi:hypothetical protein
MSWLTLMILWSAISCIASPFIGWFLARESTRTLWATKRSPELAGTPNAARTHKPECQPAFPSVEGVR